MNSSPFPGDFCFNGCWDGGGVGGGGEFRIKSAGAGSIRLNWVGLLASKKSELLFVVVVDDVDATG